MDERHIMTDLQNRMITSLANCERIFIDIQAGYKTMPTNVYNNIMDEMTEIRSILETDLSSPELQVHQDGSIDKLNKTLKETNTMLDHLNKTIQRIK